MTCHVCQANAKRFGKDRKGNQRYRCLSCRKTFTNQERVEGKYLPMDKAVLCLQLLVEGNSLRSVERITGVTLHTLLDLLILVGEKCERLFNDKIKSLPVRDIQCDEMWGFVGMKQKTLRRKLAAEPLTDTAQGDAWTFVAIERHTKMVMAWHLGKRTVRHTVDFTEKLHEATEGRFQLTTDGFAGYPDAVSYSLGTRVDFAQLIKVYAASPDGKGSERRYSPAEVVSAIPSPRWGNPDPERICTSHVERQNLTMRMMIRRLTRLTNAFSKKWDNLRAALALHFAYYNFCRIHKTLRCTPAMEAGITNTIWTLKDLLGY
ncbi:MAG TPA: IS1 family transposase [Pyrinomonadaceae bacterium]|nr:IS1 family transposase [Pyrinomonadaceae bacterium]